LRIEDFEDRQFDAAVDGEPAGVPTAHTGVAAGERHQLRFTNADDRLVLWVDGDVVPFDRPTTFDASTFRAVDESYPRYTEGHPLDAAPVGIAATGGQVTVHRAQVRRDQYYIATEQQQAMIDYDLFGFDITKMREILTDPAQWEEARFWNSRRTVEFSLEDDQFFPMGDNSPESKDARCWVDPRQSPQAPDEDAYKFAEVHYVPRDLLVGKAIFIFWPHPWKRPIPFLPNVERMGLIR
jgi:signal peptidase I